MFHSAASLVSAFHARYPAPSAETVNLQASADPDFGGQTVDGIQAAAGVLSFTQGKTRFVTATDNFRVLGNPVKAGEVVEISEADAKYLVGLGRATYATDVDIAKAQKAGK